MVEQIADFFGNAQDNKILVAVLGGGIFWQVISNIRSIFGTIWSAVLALVSFTVNSVDAGEYDRPVIRYKIEKVLSGSKVLWERNTEIQPTSCAYNEEKLMNTAFGRSYRWLWGHLVVLDRSYSTQSTKVVISITARVFFANRKRFLERLIREIEECSLVDNRDTILVNMGSGIVAEKPKRRIGSVYTDGGVAERMLEDVRSFLSNSSAYLSNGSPYKFVGLLCGTTGSGKTSTIHAIASELGMGIRFVNTDKEDFESIARMMANNNDGFGCRGYRDIVVIEDIDCMSMGATEKRDLPGRPRRRGETLDIEACDDKDTVEFKTEYNRSLQTEEGSSQMSLSSLLNLLDGLVTPSGTIVFLTTNNPDRLDPALLRDGRIDFRYEFGDFSGKTAARMVRDNLGIELEGLRDGLSPSTLQRDILKVMTKRMTEGEFREKYSREPSSV